MKSIHCCNKLLKLIMTVGLSLALMSLPTTAFAQVTSMGVIPILSMDKRDFKITLDSNPTTGYRWFLVGYNQQFIEPLSHGFEKPSKADKKAMLGAPGFEVWYFRVRKEAFTVPHMFNIEFVYKRPWEKRSVKRVSYSVVTR